MLHFFARRMKEAREDEQGFTLIELLVVVIIIGILAAIAIPTFLGQRSRAQDAQAVSNMRNGVTGMETFGAGTSPPYQFGTATPANVGPTEPNLTWDAVGTVPNNVGITANANAAGGANRGTYALQVTSRSGAIFTANANAAGQVAYTRDPDGAGAQAAAPFNP